MPSPSAARPAAKIIEPPPYEPDLEAYGLKRENGEIVAVTPCPDPDPRKAMASDRVEIDARLWEGRFDEAGRLRESRVTPRLDKAGIDQKCSRLRESLKLREDTDWFALGSWAQYGQPEGPLTSNFVPLIPGPATRQQYWADYWSSSAKCFEASTHSGIAKRACNAMVQFPLGRGMRWRIPDEAPRQAWEAFWRANKMRRRWRQIAYDLSVFGEQFLRYFPAPRGSDAILLIRQIDPATIYEVVTDQEDLETVFFYHQQFQTRMELYSPPASNRAPEGRTQPGVTRYIIRQIPAEEIDHIRINVVSGEARGRSDLFPALGDLKRLRDLLTSKVIQSDIGNRVMAVLKAQGTQADINRVLNTIFPNGQPPAPATIIGLNEASDLQPFQYTAGREVRADFTYDEIIDSICASVGIARPYLGLAPAQGAGTTQAAALTNVEPSTKQFDERQQILDEMAHDMFDRVMAAAKIQGSDIEREFIFPSIADEDRSGLLQDLELAEANSWISKRTSATVAATALDLTDYDYDEEVDLIVKEFQLADDDGQGGKIRRPVIRATSRQEAKIDPTKGSPDEDLPPGVVVGRDGKPVQGAAAAGGLDAAANPASQSNEIRQRTRESEARIRRTPDDPEFTGSAEEFARETKRNLERLLADVAP